MRKYEVASLRADGSLAILHHVAPANPLFEGMASAFARGTLIATPQGPVAIEDLAPGAPVETVGGGARRVLWIASTLLVPDAASDSLTDGPMRHMTRVMEGTFGIGRPYPGLMAGPGARLVQRRGDARLLAPITDHADGTGVIRVTPPTPVRLYHLGLARHAVIRAAGLEVESYHPGIRALDAAGANMRALFLSFFPNITRLEDFGPLCMARAGAPDGDRPAA